MVGFGLADEWVQGPLRFVEGEDGGEIFAVGTEGKGKMVREKIVASGVGRGLVSDSEEE